MAVELGFLTCSRQAHTSRGSTHKCQQSIAAQPDILSIGLADSHYAHCHIVPVSTQKSQLLQI